MNASKWLKCCVITVVLSQAAIGVAQDEVAEIFGDAPQVTPQTDESLSTERSLLAEVPAGEANQANDFCNCVGEANSPTVVRIEKALASPLRSQGLDFVDTALEVVVAQLQDEYGIPIEIDTLALDEIGIGTDEPITINLSGVSLRSGLRLLLRNLQLTYIIRDEVLMITTPEAAEQELIVCVYDVREIVEPANDQSVDQLMDAIVSCVETDTWADNGGGEAEIRWLKSGYLVVSQTQAVHEEIGDLLATIRHIRKRSAKAGAGAADAAATAAADANRVTTRFFRLELGEAANPEAVRTQIRDLITDSLPDERWQGKLGDGQPVVLSILPDRVVLRHKPAVQEKVEALLTESGLAAAPAASGRRGLRGGGQGDDNGGGFFQPQPAVDN